MSVNIEFGLCKNPGGGMTFLLLTATTINPNLDLPCPTSEQLLLSLLVFKYDLSSLNQIH